ncbi:MAG TPA: preprotein translocase subunit YajC [Gaiellaceae bacterium]|nr:preprotein translocase subunit YajC [Gaiellaceae bacterium]
MSFLIVMVLLLVVMYVLMIRPQRQRQRDHQSLIEGAGVGDDILTTGGIYGTITRVEDDDVVVEIADGLNVHMTRRGIAAVLPPEDETASETIDAEAVEEPDDDEPPVTAGEEAVTSEADAEAAAADRR